MASNAQQAAALRAAGFDDAAALIESLNRDPRQQPSAGTPGPRIVDGERPMSPEEQAFSDQIREAQAKSGGWTSMPIDTPIVDDPGRF
jgi:hypothetical protein